MGFVAAPFGVQGWVRVHALTETPDSLLDYPTWWLGRDGDWRECRVAASGVHSKGVVVKLAGVADRDAALALQGQQIAVSRSAMPEPPADEFYWADLIGLSVKNTAGEDLGRVVGLLETGANDVLQVRQGERELLIPFVAHVVLKVDKPGGEITVEWGADY
ncbi:MAG: ribosome maturation factor RimM [Sulfuricellaceae bacterium]|nr:ribosome maturation factor RimM [Sulfuricellaceae bacterium]